MGRYRKKPVVIEAWQWLFSDEQEECPEWVNAAAIKWPEQGSLCFEPNHSYGARISICTLEGVMCAVPGDFIIQGVQGEIYPCKPDIFEQTYELVHEGEMVCRNG